MKNLPEPEMSNEMRNGFNAICGVGRAVGLIEEYFNKRQPVETLGSSPLLFCS